MRELIFIHGRAQENKDSKALKAEWIAALNEGLAQSGLALPIPESAIHFPYYGDTLYDLAKGESATEAAEVVVRGAKEEQAFVRAILVEIATQRGFAADIDQTDPDEVATSLNDEQRRRGGDDRLLNHLHDETRQRGPLNWPWMQNVLRVIDRHVPFGSSRSIALFTHDAYVYLNRPDVSSIIDAGVTKAFSANKPSVVVSHSLGSVIAYDLLRRVGETNHWEISFFVTVGSPLAVSAIKERLHPTYHPKCVGSWYNALDTRDVVALYPLDKANFPIEPEITNYTKVKNHTSNRHGIAGYLDDPIVAKRIYDELIK